MQDLSLPHLPALAALLAATSDGVVFRDADGIVVAANGRAAEIVGKELVGAALPFESVAGDQTVRGPRGRKRDIVVTTQPVVAGVPPQTCGSVTVFTDVTEQRRAEADVQNLLSLVRREALTDSLTGLANRRAFDERLEAELSRARRHHQPISLALLDLDRFKELNDRHGHPAGDRALARVADILRDCVRTEDTAARLAGDEFAVILPGTRAEEAQPAMLRVISHVASDPLLAELGTTLSAGVADVVDGDAAALYSAADQTLYASKRAGGARVSI